METYASRAGHVGHVLAFCRWIVVLSGWAHEDPTDAVDEFAVGCAWWCRGVGGGGGAATNSTTTVSLNFTIDCVTCSV